MEISKVHSKRRDIREDILQRDNKILRSLALEKSKEKKREEKEEERNINTEQQKISNSVDFIF